ncbi:MAG: hypothetical protein QOH49_370 [Acidobacteriota bacterium]|jgi:hypothetical protein|nr:hypothetical protein [Acidobacteriota bacterium]
MPGKISYSLLLIPLESHVRNIAAFRLAFYRVSLVPNARHPRRPAPLMYMRSSVSAVGCMPL